MKDKHEAVVAERAEQREQDQDDMSDAELCLKQGKHAAAIQKLIKTELKMTAVANAQLVALNDYVELARPILSLKMKIFMDEGSEMESVEEVEAAVRKNEKTRQAFRDKVIYSHSHFHLYFSFFVYLS